VEGKGNDKQRRFSLILKGRGKKRKIPRKLPEFHFACDSIERERDLKLAEEKGYLEEKKKRVRTYGAGNNSHLCAQYERGKKKETGGHHWPEGESPCFLSVWP